MRALTYVTALVSLLVIDSVWLFSMRPFYKKYIGYLMGESFKWGAAVVFYPLYALAIVIFIVAPALRNQTSLIHTFLLGALLGLTAYGAYDLTNHATIKDWSIVMTLVDMLWGAVLTGAVSLIVVKIFQQ